MTTLEARIAAAFVAWTPKLECEILGVQTPIEIATAIEAFCVEHLGSAVADAEFFWSSVGSVAGLHLVDGRRVVVKLFRPGTSSDALQAGLAVQAALAASGFPCPIPLLGPTPVGRGLAIVESLLDSGMRADAHEPAVRRAMTATLAELVARATALAPATGIADAGPPTQSLWPEPHDLRFDFTATARGAEWIDEFGRTALDTMARAASAAVVCHCDWRIQNLRFVDHAVSAIFDWDSLRRGSEAGMVGMQAHQFTSDYSRANWKQLPTLEEALRFIQEYEHARGRPFTPAEQREARAGLAYAMAYAARCEHSDSLTNFGTTPVSAVSTHPVPDDSARAFLRRHGAELEMFDASSSCA